MKERVLELISKYMNGKEVTYDNLTQKHLLPVRGKARLTVDGPADITFNDNIALDFHEVTNYVEFIRFNSLTLQTEYGLIVDTWHDNKLHNVHYFLVPVTSNQADAINKRLHRLRYLIESLRLQQRLRESEDA